MIDYNMIKVFCFSLYDTERKCHILGGQYPTEKECVEACILSCSDLIEKGVNFGVYRYERFV